MEIILSILPLLVHYTYGYHNEHIYFLHQPADHNTSVNTANIDRLIFDPFDVKMRDTYRDLLRLFNNHWLNYSRDPNKDWQQNHDTFWKIFKLTAAYLKYEHHKDSFEDKDTSNQTQQSTEPDSILDTDTLFHNMLRYYSKLAAQRPSYFTQINDTAPVRPHIPVISHLKGKFVSFWNRFGWWRKTEPPPQRNITPNGTNSVLYFVLNVFNRKNYTANASFPYDTYDSVQKPPTFRARRLLNDENYAQYEFFNIFENFGQQFEEPPTTTDSKEITAPYFSYYAEGTEPFGTNEEIDNGYGSSDEKTEEEEEEQETEWPTDK